MSKDTAARGLLEPDTYVPEDGTLSEEEMDAVCRELVASSQAYQQGEVPMRETVYYQGKPYTTWNFIDGRAADMYTVVVKRHRPINLFTASVTELEGCSASGITQHEALANARQAIDTWIDTAVSEGRAIPLPQERLTRLVKEQEAA